MIGCLCIHGFTGGPYEVEPLVEYLRETTDWQFAVPTLPGHGEPLALKGIRFHQWIQHAEEALKKLLSTCEQVYIIGFSMGGLIASYLAAQYPVTKLVLLSAAAQYLNPRQMAADVREMLADTIRGELKQNELFQRYKRKLTETPITAAFQFRSLVAHIRPRLKEIKVPTLIAQGESDGIVPPRSAEYLYRNIGAHEKKLLFIKGSKHHICHCAEKDALFSEVMEFLKA